MYNAFGTFYFSDAQEVVLDPDSAHPKLIISPEGDSVTYNDTWQEVSENPSRFDTTLNVISRKGFTDVRNYWEVQVTGKTYWELGLTYPNIPRKGQEEDCWLGRGPTSWCIEYLNGNYTAWHNGIPNELTHVSGRTFQRIGIFSSSEGGLVCFLGADTMTPLYSFCAGTFTDSLYQAFCPGHDNQETNRKPLFICDASKSNPILWWKPMSVGVVIHLFSEDALNWLKDEDKDVHNVTQVSMSKECCF